MISLAARIGEILLVCVADSERPRLVIVREKFGIPRPTDDGAQRLLRVARIQMVFQFGLKSHPRCEVTLALIEDMTDMGGGSPALAPIGGRPAAVSALFRPAGS